MFRLDKKMWDHRLSVITKVSHLYDKKILANALKMQIMTVWLGAETVWPPAGDTHPHPHCRQASDLRQGSWCLYLWPEQTLALPQICRGSAAHRQSHKDRGEMFELLIPPLLSSLCVSSAVSDLWLATLVTAAQPPTLNWPNPNQKLRKWEKNLKRLKDGKRDQMDQIQIDNAMMTTV